MTATPRTDAAEFEIDERGAPSNFVVPVDVARQLEQELHWARVRIAEMQKEFNEITLAHRDVTLTAVKERVRANEAEQDRACLLDDVRKGDNMLMAWFKAASPWATPGSLEEGLKNLRNEVIEECAQLVEARAGQGPYAESMGAYQILTSAARAVRALNNAAPQPCTCHPDDNPPVPCPRKYALMECLKAANNAAPHIALVRQAIFHVLDGGRDGLVWDFDDDEDRVDFADAVVAWMVK